MPFDPIKAVAVAKDVIQQLRLKRLHPEGNGYIYSPQPIPEVAAAFNADSECDLQSVVDVVSQKCGVCAKGALVLSMARLYNNIPLGPLVIVHTVGKIGASNPGEILGDVFEWDVISLIEAAYEQSYYFANWSDRATAMAATNFGKKYTNPANRLRAIMLNVIKNKGRFVPPRKKVTA